MAKNGLHLIIMYWLYPGGDNQWTRPIFKLPMGDRVGKEQIDMSTSVENE